MSVPRVFISSTYYDLKYVRDDIGGFIKSLGYEPVMHDKGNVTYTQSQTLEQSCYNEISTCDIVVCIIGNKYRTQSSGSDYSITMEELLTEVKQKKKIYIFIANDVYIENNIYLENKDTGNFISKYADNIKIHEFITEIREKIRNHPIQPFNNVSDIIDVLRQQFAGLFQYLLTQESSATESKTYYDLQKSTQEIQRLINSLGEEKEELFKKFDSSIFATNFTLKILRQKLGMKKAIFFAKDKESLDEILGLMGFVSNGLPFPPYAYEKVIGNLKTVIKLDEELFESDGRLKDTRQSDYVEKHISVEEVEVEEDDGLPF